MRAVTGRVWLCAMAVLVTAVLSTKQASALGSQTAAGSAAETDEPPGLQQLADRYAPILHLKEQSAPCSTSGDPYNPEPVDIVLGNASVVLRERTSSGDIAVKSAPTAADLFGLNNSYYLDFPGDPRNRSCQQEQDADSFSRGQPNVTYVHLAREANHPGFALQYWFFYYFNAWNNRHEGDWEMIQIDFAQDTPQEALHHEPISLIYSQHSGGERAKWTSGKVHKHDDHPVVYVGSGSHSNFYTPGLYLGRGENGSGLGCDDATGPSREIAPVTRLVPQPVVSATDPYAWITFQGAWGQLAGGEDDGPNGPNTTYQWFLPFHWEQDQRHSSITVPGGNFVGGNAATFFCNAVSFGARALNFAHEWPLVTSGSAGLVGILSLGLVVIGLKDARRTLIEPVNRPGFLRRKRRLGEVLRLAVHMYRRHAPAFLMITVIYIPLGFLALGIQEGLTRVPPFSNVIDFFDARAAGTMLALLYGSIENLLALIFVVAALTAAIAELERTGRVSVWQAWKRMWEKAAALAYGRFRALGIVALFGITIFGIPFAIRHAVRWYFIEQSIVLDDATGRESAQRSSELVDGEWWRTAFIALAVAVIVALTGPVIAAALILTTTLPLQVVNLVNSIVYVLLIPYVALVLALVYFDLQARKAERDAASAGRKRAD